LCLDGERSAFKVTHEDHADQQEYQDLLALEDLESLLEELEEQWLTGQVPGEHIPPELQERMQALGVKDVQQIRDRIMHLHARLDDTEDELRITES
jgi:hypothetical protein